ncbi:MAG: hypothetical protein HQK96_11750 [Nitrospirae bacterium]|nr:hypothetical protein [Nitrospirota bacterium]
METILANAIDSTNSINIEEFKAEAERIKYKLESQMQHMSRSWKAALSGGYLQNEHYKRCEEITPFFDFELIMFNDFEIEIASLKHDQDIDRQKLSFWYAILNKADEDCKDAKRDFSMKVFKPFAKIEETFNKTFETHKKLILALSKHKALLPKDTLKSLDELMPIVNQNNNASREEREVKQQGEDQRHSNSKQSERPRRYM